MGRNATINPSPIKSIQRGSVILGSNSSTNITIAAVDISKSFLNVSTSNGAAGTNNNYANSFVVGGKFTSATNILVDSGRVIGLDTTYNCVAYWEAIEYV